MVIEFDCYLIDEVIAVGDQRFHERCQIELFEKRRDRSMIIVSHSADFIKAHCDDAGVVVKGKLHFFPTVDEGFAFYNEHSAEQ
jgi:capsular polysaccharide transport system ATP-binding protein